jgi:PAS domain S-box-containing protein
MQALTAVDTSHELYRTLVEASPGLVWRCDREGRYTFLNRAWERTLGYRPDELLGRTLRDFQPADAKTGAAVEPFATDFEAVQVARDGRELCLHFSATVLRDGEGRLIGSQGTAHDVTDRRLVEAYEAGGREVLEILNEPGSLAECIQRVLEALRSRSRCDAAGIRLEDGEDYPYFVQAGFSAGFLKTENSILKKENGAICRGRDGAVCLECTCGLVISGRSSPYLTAHGSFWTNDSPSLLSLSPEVDPRRNPRNQCIHHGYASVALVPIRRKGAIIGLLQLNDRRPGRFSLQAVEALEDIASHIGQALVRKAIDEALRQSEQKLREYQEQLKRMAFEAAVVQERERRRFAVDLHDSIGQSLALARIKLTSVRGNARGAPRTAIDEVVALLEQSIRDSRSLVFALSPPVLYDLGLEAAISWLIDDLRQKHGLVVELAVEGAALSLDETTAGVVFRAVRELLMNVLKHAQTMAARVSVHQGSERLEVIVEDEGVGFDPDETPSAPRGSFGLFSLREQISRVGGSLALTSARGGGTRACVRITQQALVEVRPKDEGPRLQ